MPQDTGPPKDAPFIPEAVKHYTWACKNGYHEACLGQVRTDTLRMPCACDHHKAPA